MTVRLILAVLLSVHLLLIFATCVFTWTTIKIGIGLVLFVWRLLPFTIIKIIISLFMSTCTNALWMYRDYLDYKKLGYDKEKIPWIFVFICWLLQVCFCFQVFSIF